MAHCAPVAAEVLEARLLLASPTANNDTYSVTHDTTLNAQNGVLLNDSDPDSDTLTASLVSGVSHGSLALFGNGTFIYTPGYHYAGPDSFTYKAFDGTSYSNVATVTINVTNAAPVGNADSYTIYKDSFNSATEGAAKVLANDIDQNGDPLTAILVSGPANGSLTLNSDGSFSYTPNAGYFGNDSFVYKATDGIAQSADTTVALTVTSPFSAQVNGQDQPVAGLEDQGNFAASLLTGETAVALPAGAGQTLIYNSLSADRRPAIAVETTWNPLAAAPTRIEATLTFNGVTGATVYYQGNGVQPNDTLRFVLQADANNLPTGRYNYTVTLVARYGSNTATRTFSGTCDVVNRGASEFGPGWTLAGLDKLESASGGQLLVASSGAAFFFQDNGNGTFTSPAGPLFAATLVRNANNTYTLTAPTGEQAHFNTLGLLTSRVDLNSNTVAYAYIDANGDGQAKELSTITDPFGRVTTFNYTNGKVSSVTDFAGRVTTLARDGNGRVASATLPDPDGAGPLSAPVISLAYDASHRLASITNPLNQATTLEYAFSGRLKKATYADGNNRQFQPLQTQGLVDLSTGSGTIANPAALYKLSANYLLTNEQGQQTTVRTDRFGLVTYHKDPSGVVTQYQRDANGLVTQITQNDPDGAGPLVSPITSLQYDAKGNLTQITHANGTTESFTYHATLNRPLTHTNQRGKTTSFAYDANGNLLTITDPLGNVTTFTYNARGQVLTSTTPDPDGAGPQSPQVTSFQYDGYGRLTQITNPGGSTRQFAYNSADNLTSATDELGRVTNFSYDNLDRQVGVTLPDPDGAGPLAAPVFSYAFNAAGLLTSAADPLGNATTYSYNARGWLTSITAPDPDGAGPQTAPVTTFGYDPAGRRTSVTDPLGKQTTYTWSANSLLTKITAPDPDGAGPLFAPETQLVYDGLNRVTQVKDPLLKSTTYKYDALSRVIEVTTPLGNKTSLAYDAAGNVLTVTAPDPDGAGPLAAPVTSFSYDDLGRLVSETNPRGYAC